MRFDADGERVFYPVAPFGRGFRVTESQAMRLHRFAAGADLLVLFSYLHLLFQLGPGQEVILAFICLLLTAAVRVIGTFLLAADGVATAERFPLRQYVAGRYAGTRIELFAAWIVVLTVVMAGSMTALLVVPSDWIPVCLGSSLMAFWLQLLLVPGIFVSRPHDD